MKAVRSGRWDRKPETRPDEILDAALQVFAINGYRGTRLEQVAEAAGVTKGTIYHYFSSKEQLLLEAARKRRTRIFAEAEAAIGDSSEPASVRLRRGHHMAWHRWCNPQSRQLLRLMISEVSVEAPAVFQEWLRDGFLRGIRLMAGLIEEGKKNGEFRPDVDAEVAARVMNSGMFFHLLLHYEMGMNEIAPIDIERFIDAQRTQGGTVAGPHAVLEPGMRSRGRLAGDRAGIVAAGCPYQCAGRHSHRGQGSAIYRRVWLQASPGSEEQVTLFRVTESK